MYVCIHEFKHVGTGRAHRARAHTHNLWYRIWLLRHVTIPPRIPPRSPSLDACLHLLRRVSTHSKLEQGEHVRQPCICAHAQLPEVVGPARQRRTVG